MIEHAIRQYLRILSGTATTRHDSPTDVLRNSSASSAVEAGTLSQGIAKMIERYTLPEMGRIWTEENKLSIWLEIEILACEARAELGEIPRAVAETVRSKGSFDIDRIHQIEESTHHDVVAFLTNINENIGEESRHVHFGMTSSDVGDTALSVQLKQAGEIIRRKLHRLLETLGRRSREFKDTPCIGRTHGVHAEPMTFGLKLLLWFDEIRRHTHRWDAAVQSISYGQISGSVGTHAHLDPGVEEFVCGRLGLLPAPVSNQILQRDRHAEYVVGLANIASTLEKMATEVRNLQRTDVREVEEQFRRGQKGSSSMPHKRNPIYSERVSGLARVVRGNAAAALQNVALWHERDISHSSCERVILPDSTICVDYMLQLMIDIVGGLVVYPDNMMSNFRKTGGLPFSQALLLQIVKKGRTREEAYAHVQRVSMDAWERQVSFEELVRSDDEIGEILNEEEIGAVFSLDRYFRNIDFIFDRVLGSGEDVV